MKIGIHPKGAFSEKWIAYCISNNISYKLVDCHQTDVLNQLKDCDALMWHVNHANDSDFLFAKQLLYSVEVSGRSVFPDFSTVWHFDDKIGQKYLLESIKAPLVPSYVFYSKSDATKWIQNAKFPVVFKLRSGAGAHNVKLAETKANAFQIVEKAFGAGFSLYSARQDVKERVRKFMLKQSTIKHVLSGIVRLVFPPENTKFRSKEKGYVYFQEFVKDNDHDIRIIVIDDKAFAIKRQVRNNDFRASGSGMVNYARELFNEDTIRLAFEIARDLNSQCVAFDFLTKEGNPVLLEISFGFSISGYINCPGYWDRRLNWHEGSFNPYGWMVEGVIKDVKNRKESCILV